jgi:cytochrome b6-f complex iron-sulfur subunit
MAKISDLSGEAREQRIAELKKKMQEAAAKAQAAEKATEAAPAPAAAPKPAAKPAPKAETAPAATVEPVETTAVAAPVREAAPEENGSAAPKAAPAPAAAPRPAPKPKPEAEPVAPAVSPEEMNRREFLTYAWGAALGLLSLEAGVGSFLFMYPRFRAGEFGGKFFIGPETALPDPSTPPQPNTSGKFWLVRTEDGSPKAIYMVCTHLGCLYKWEESNGRFECPCHGSKFTHDGFYIEGPAPRSLDYFEIAIENGEVVVDTGAKITGAPSTESPARAAA